MDTCHFPDCDKPIFVKQTSLGSLCNGHYAQLRRNKPLGPLRGYNQGATNSTSDICPHPSCGRHSWHKHGLCQTHQRQLWEANGNESALKTIRTHNPQAGETCKEEGCDKPCKSRGYCSKHYRQDWGVCTLPGCGRRKHNKSTGYCALHYSKFRKLNTPVETEATNAS